MNGNQESAAMIMNDPTERVRSSSTFVKQHPDPAWHLTETTFNAQTALAWEGLLTQGNGYLHIRGSLEEHFPDAPQNDTYLRMPGNVTVEKFTATTAKWGTFIPGIFGTHPFFVREMVNLPWFLGVIIHVDGERLCMSTSDMPGYARSLNLRNGVLTRTVEWKTKSGAWVSVAFSRFISTARKHLCCQRIQMKSDRDVKLRIESLIDADVRTSGFDHCASVAFSHPAANRVSCDYITDTKQQVCIVSEMKAPFPLEYVHLERRCSLNGTMELHGGESVTLEKRTAIGTGNDLDHTDLAGVLDETAECTYGDLMNDHSLLWAQRWEYSDVEVEGDPDSQVALRSSIYHLLRCHVPDDPRVSIDAKGYAGDAYYGHFFWDTEMYMLPFYLYTDPVRAKTLVDFRVQSLPGAMDNAREYGYRGARFAWESDDRGSECCAKGNWQYRDHEVHITADVVYGIRHYCKAVGNDTYMRTHAGELLSQTARYWMDRISHRPGDMFPSLLGIMGPDEYTPITANNSFTNRMVSLNLECAAGYGADATEEERRNWSEHAATLPVMKKGNLVLQSEDFILLDEPRFDVKWRDRGRHFASQVSQEYLYRTKCSKQADVLMLMFLFGNEFTDAQVTTAWDYYEPLCTHDSSLSHGIHALIALRLGKNQEAWKFWKNTAGIDLDIEHGGAAQGVHIANAAATWMVAVMGFAGMKQVTETDVFTLTPKLPVQWKSLRFSIVWKSVPLRVMMTEGRCMVENAGACAIMVRVGAVEKKVHAGETICFDC